MEEASPVGNRRHGDMFGARQATTWMLMFVTPENQFIIWAGDRYNYAN
jgi:hypothetical protein